MNTLFLMFTFSFFLSLLLLHQCPSSVVPDMKRTFNATNENPQETKMLKRSLTIFGNVSNTSNMSAKKKHVLSYYHSSSGQTKGIFEEHGLF